MCNHKNKRPLFMALKGKWRKTEYVMCEDCEVIFKKETKELDPKLIKKEGEN